MMTKLFVSYQHTNFSHFYFGIFSLLRWESALYVELFFQLGFCTPLALQSGKYRGGVNFLAILLGVILIACCSGVTSIKFLV